MSDEINQATLTECINDIRNDVINSLQANGRYATGDTIANLVDTVGEDYAALFAPWWIDALEYGRKPTSPGAPTGDPTLFERIEAWIAAKGLDLNPYAVTKKIHKYGYPGTPGILTEPLSDDSIDKHVSEAANIIADNEAKKVLDLFDIFGK